jgi:hypothetical protein
MLLLRWDFPLGLLKDGIQNILIEGVPTNFVASSLKTSQERLCLDVVSGRTSPKLRHCVGGAKTPRKPHGLPEETLRNV